MCVLPLGPSLVRARAYLCVPPSGSSLVCAAVLASVCRPPLG